MSNHAKEQGIPHDAEDAAGAGRCQRKLARRLSPYVEMPLVCITDHLAGDAAKSQTAHEGM